jgi:hypothetical protein
MYAALGIAGCAAQSAMQQAASDEMPSGDQKKGEVIICAGLEHRATMPWRRLISTPCRT